MPASEPLSLRRKRTIFFTAKSPEVANAAHSIFQCCAAREGGGASEGDGGCASGATAESAAGSAWCTSTRTARTP